MTHLQNGRHNFKSHRSEENALRLPKIDNNSYRNKGQDAHYSSYKPPYVYDENQKLKDEIKFLKEYLWRQTDKHAKEIRLLETLSKDIIELQTNEIQKLETEKRNFERKNYELEKMLNNKNNETDDEKEVWFQESSKRISYLQNELENSVIKMEAMKSEKNDVEVRLTTFIQALEIELEQCTQKIKRLEKKIDEREKQLTEARNEILLKKGIATQNERKNHQNVKRANELQDEINRLNVRLQQMYTTLKDTEVELSETKTR
jgi:chromosome segregation ATPase